MTAMPETRYLKTPDGVFLAYQVVGNGPVDVSVVFHPNESNVDLMWDEPDWRPFLVGIAEFARLIVHDRRGLGVSSRNVPPPNLETQVADLLAVLDAAGSQRPILAGGDLSAAVNALFAATYPDRVRGLIWNNPTVRAAWARDYPWGERRSDFASRLRNAPLWGSRAHARRIAIWRLAERLGVPEDELTEAVDRERVDVYARIIRNSAAPDVAEAIRRIAYDTDVRAVLPLVKVPAVLVTGTKDNQDEAAYVASLMPNATVRVVEGRSGVAVDPFLAALRDLAGIERDTPDFDTVLATVLFTDIVDSTAKQAALGDRAWKDLVVAHHAVVRDALARWRGAENDTAGDGFFASFEGPARAVRCAIEVADRVRPLGIEVRAGVHTGECQVVDGKHAGITVSIAARVAAAANGSDVLVTQTVKDLVAGSGLRFEEKGEHQLKGVPNPWRLYAAFA